MALPESIIVGFVIDVFARTMMNSVWKIDRSQTVKLTTIPLWTGAILAFHGCVELGSENLSVTCTPLFNRIRCIRHCPIGEFLDD
jgi:hypothetical protein